VKVEIFIEMPPPERAALIYVFGLSCRIQGIGKVPGGIENHVPSTDDLMDYARMVPVRRAIEGSVEKVERKLLLSLEKQV
jgi:hypothetical protein